MNVIDYLGRPISELLHSAPFKSWPVERSIDDDLAERVIEYVFEGHGLEVQCDPTDHIATIFMTASEGWDEALFDIPFSLTRPQLLNRFGKPEKSGKRTRDPILGEWGAWDRFIVPEGVLHIQYQFDERGIAKITLMRRDVAP